MFFFFSGKRLNSACWRCSFGWSFEPMKITCEASAPGEREVTSHLPGVFFLTENYTSRAKPQRYGRLRARLMAHLWDANLLKCYILQSLRQGLEKLLRSCAFLYDHQRSFSIDRRIEENVGCPYHSCRIHDVRTLRNDEIIIQGPYQGHSFYRTPAGCT